MPKPPPCTITPDDLKSYAADLIRASLEGDHDMAVVVVNELTEAEARDALRLLVGALSNALWSTPRARAHMLAALEDGWPTA